MKTLIVLLFPLAMFAQNAALSPTPLQTLLDNNGHTFTGCLYTFSAGTTTPEYTFSNRDLAVGHRNPNPITLNSSGRPPVMYFSPVSYKIVLGQRTLGSCPSTPGTVLWSQDDVFDAGQLLKTALALPTGAGLIGYNYGNTYASGTVGKALQDAVNFSQSTSYLAGTVGKHLQQESINPMDAPYNALCNNVHDDTTNVQAAVDAAAARQITLMFPGVGYCRITAPITITTAKTTLAGSGPRSGLSASTPTFNMIEVVSADDFTADNFSLIGAAVDDTNNKFGISTDAATPSLRGRISRLTFDGVNDGIKLDTANNGWNIHDSHFQHLMGITSGRGYGVLLGRANSNTISHNFFYGDVGTAGRHAVYFSDGSCYNTVDHNHVDSFNKSNFAFFSTDTGHPNCGNVLDSNVSTNAQVGDAGGAVWELTGANSDNLIVSNEAISPASTCGIAISLNLHGSANSNTMFKNNVCSGSGRNGIQLQGATNPVVDGNILINGSTSSSGTYAAIEITTSSNVVGRDGTDGARLGGNTIYGADWRDALLIQNTAPLAVNTYIAGNNWKAGLTSLIENAGGALLKRGINPVAGTTSETIDTTLVMPTSYTIQGDSAATTSDAWFKGSTTNNNAVVGISGDATGLNQAFKIINSAAGGGVFTIGENAAVKVLSVIGRTNSNVWGFNDLAAASGGGGFEAPFIRSTGTRFTVTGCSADTPAGGATAGSFLSKSSATCTFVITMGGASGLTAPTGWACFASDITTGTVLAQSASTTTTCSVTGATTTGDKVQFFAVAF